MPQSWESFATLDMTLRGRGELGGDWTRFRPCEAGVLGSCEPSLFPQLKPDVQFGVRLTGTVSDRIHVDVDYDETREFSAANNINIYYQGLEGEAIQRVEVGDVSLALPESRFLTDGVPAGNFGFRAAGGLGPRAGGHSGGLRAAVAAPPLFVGVIVWGCFRGPFVV